MINTEELFRSALHLTAPWIISLLKLMKENVDLISGLIFLRVRNFPVLYVTH